MTQKQYPLRNGIRFILLITLVISGLPWAVWVGYGLYLEWRAKDPANHIVAIVQKSSEPGILKNDFLAEVLGLSYDNPNNLYGFNTPSAEKRLMHSPVIKSAKVKKIPPGTIYVDYQPRKPIAFLGDQTNTALDEEGIPFPFKPYFTPKKLPIIFIGLAQTDHYPADWGKPILSPHMHIALKLLKNITQVIKNKGYKLIALDLSNYTASSFGQREIVIILENQFQTSENETQMVPAKPLYVRLNAENYGLAFGNFLELDKLLKSRSEKLPKVVDLRVPHYAYLL